MTELHHFHPARKGSGSLRPFPIYPLYTRTVILSLDKPIADCFLFRPRKSCEKRRKSTPKPPARYASHYRYTRKHFHSHSSMPIPFWTSSHKWLTFAFILEIEYTLVSLRKIAHSGLHAETRGFTLVQPRWAFDRLSSSKRTVGGSGCTPTACVRFLRRRSPAGLRNTLFGLPMLYFSRSAHGDFCVCEVGAVSPPSAYSAYCRNSRCPLVKMTNLLFP